MEHSISYKIIFYQFFFSGSVWREEWVGVKMVGVCHGFSSSLWKSKSSLCFKNFAFITENSSNSHAYDYEYLIVPMILNEFLIPLILFSIFIKKMTILIHFQITAGDKNFKCLLRMAVVIMHEQRCEFNPSLSFIRIFGDCIVYLVVEF